MTAKTRRIHRVLVANRGEIAQRIIKACRELELQTIAVYTEHDELHIYNATEAIKLPSASSYLDVDEIVGLAHANNVDAVHPGYGFLSESGELARRLYEVGIIFIGPTEDLLNQTGDKLQARKLAHQCNVPVLPALDRATNNIDEVSSFVQQHGLPVMVKAVDGGGGRGIRLLRRAEDIDSLTQRAIEESPSKQVFAERAAINGFKHIEIQIIADTHGNVMHLWERECSIQRRYQKIIEFAPSSASRQTVRPLIEAAINMARQIRYESLGTFEFLLNPDSGEFFFLEVNPRLQVEHTITEAICNVDIVKTQLQLAQGARLEDTELAGLAQDPLLPPRLHAIQLRLTAEDPEKAWRLSGGKIQTHRLPSGQGVRVDTALINDIPQSVTASFDSVIAKIILTAPSWSGAAAKARRALEDTMIMGVQTNLEILMAIATHRDFLGQNCDTQWLEVNQADLLQQARKLRAERNDPLHGLVRPEQKTSSMINSSSAPLRKDDAWSLALKDLNSSTSGSVQNHLKLLKVLKNDFPTSLSAEIAFTSHDRQEKKFLLDLHATSASASALTSQHRRGDSTNPSHVTIPFAGKLVEVCVDVGDAVKQGDCIAVVQQMKMELEIRCQVSGVISWICDIDDSEDVVEGLLVAVIESQEKSRL